MSNPQPAPSPAQSPLGASSSANTPTLSIRERPLQGYLNLRGQPEQTAFTDAAASVLGGTELPGTPNTVASAGGASVLWLAPSEWLLVTAPDAQRALAESLREALGDLFAAVIDVSSGYSTLQISGIAAGDLLARGCALDLHPRVFAAGRCAQTLVAKADAIVWRVDESPSFDVIVRRSLADYLRRWLDDAAHDLGSTPGV